MASKPAKVDLDTVGQNAARKWDLKAYNTDDLLGKAFYFFECQESGKLRPNHRVKWRGNSYLKDGFKNKLDLVGGWHDAGGAARAVSTLRACKHCLTDRNARSTGFVNAVLSCPQSCRIGESDAAGHARRRNPYLADRRP